MAVFDVVLIYEVMPGYQKYRDTCFVVRRCPMGQWLESHAVREGCFPVAWHPPECQLCAGRLHVACTTGPLLMRIYLEG
jgi:hypothetical protein